MYFLFRSRVKLNNYFQILQKDAECLCYQYSRKKIDHIFRQISLSCDITNCHFVPTLKYNCHPHRRLTDKLDTFLEASDDAQQNKGNKFLIFIEFVLSGALRS